MATSTHGFTGNFHCTNAANLAHTTNWDVVVWRSPWISGRLPVKIVREDQKMVGAYCFQKYLCSRFRFVFLFHSSLLISFCYWDSVACVCVCVLTLFCGCCRVRWFRHMCLFNKSVSYYSIAHMRTRGPSQSKHSTRKEYNNCLKVGVSLFGPMSGAF